MSHIMIDLETWGLRPGAAPRSIGAVVFHPATGVIGEGFYVNVDRASCEALGLHIEPATEAWWATQPKAAQDALVDNQLPITEAISAFCKWWDKVRGVHVWSHGANFDEVHLRVVLDTVGLDTPWKFWDVRCSRTVLALGNRAPDRSKGVHHNSLDDAIAQAVAVSAALKGWPGAYFG